MMIMFTAICDLSAVFPRRPLGIRKVIVTGAVH